MLSRRSLRLTGVPILALTLFSACYRYVPTTTAEVVPGGAYRGHFTPEGSQQVSRLVGENVEHFDGRIVSVLDTAWLVSMSATVKRADANLTIWTGEQLVIPRSAVNRFELRQLDRPRTIRAAVLYTLGISALGLAVFSISNVVSGSGSPATQPPPP